MQTEASTKPMKQIDMTCGPIMKKVLLFAIPICAGNLLQQLYNTVDTLVIGNFCGSSSLAAVGTSAQPVEILLCIFLGLGTGVSILASQYVGRNDPESLIDLTATSVSFLYICAVPLSLLGPVIGSAVLGFMQVPGDAWDFADAYIRIVLLGSLGNMGYNMNAGILRGLGDSRASLLFLFIACLVNVVLDLLFVAGFGMDVPGAALATAIAMYCSWIFSILYIKHAYPQLKLTVFPRRLKGRLVREILRIGLPLGLNSSIYSIGHILLQSLVNLQGSVFMAGWAVGTRINNIANMAITSFSSAATTFSGQNLGAENYVYLKKGGIRIPLFSALVTAAAGCLMVLNCRPVIGFFTQEAAVADIAVRYVSIILPFSWCYAVLNCIICFINGMGQVRFPTIVNILMLWAVRIPAAYLIARFVDGGYIMASMSISFVFGMSCMLTYYLSRQWKDICRRAALS